MEERSRIEERWAEYLKALYQEKQNLEATPHTLAQKLVEQEIQRVQSDIRAAGKPESKYADVIREKPIRVTTRIVVPVRDHPKFNFVGKLLGPKGNSLKRLQEETLTRMAILGRGSMRDKVKEEELRKSNHPRAAHLQEELHVEIVAFAPPAEAYARMAYALTQVRRYLIPDNNDQIRQEQMQEMKRLGLKDDRVAELRPPAGADAREQTGLEMEETASGSSPGQESCAAPAEDDPKGADELEGGAVLLPRMLTPLPGAPPQRQRVLNILDRARLISESSRIAKMAKGVDSRSFAVESHYEIPEAFIAPEARGSIQWLGLGGPMERRRLRHAPYIIPK